MPSLTSRTGDYVQRRKNIMPMARLLNHFYAKLMICMRTSNKSRKKKEFGITISVYMNISINDNNKTTSQHLIYAT